MAKFYNKLVKPRAFVPGDMVLKRNFQKKKFEMNWEGLYKVKNIVRSGVYQLEDLNGRELKHPWNGENLRKYYK